jgi:hypothetical protein
MGTYYALKTLAESGITFDGTSFDDLADHRWRPGTSQYFLPSISSTSIHL